MNTQSDDHKQPLQLSNGHQLNDRQPFTGEIEKVLTAMRDEPTCRAILDRIEKKPDFDVAKVPGITEPESLIWTLRCKHATGAIKEGKPLDDVVAEKLKWATTSSAARDALAWLQNPQRTYITPAFEGEKIARQLVEKWTRTPRFPRIKLREIFNRPRLEYLVYGIFVEVGTGVVTSKYGGYKSFVCGVDLGLSVALGRAWYGHATKKKTVIYIMPEGAYETESRVKAYLDYHDIEEVPDNFEIIEMPVQIAEAAQVAALIEDLRELAPGLIILDTLAKCNLGRDENNASDMGLFTNGMEVIARELQCFVLAIHHNNKNGDARGSVSLPANVDASITMKPAPNRIVTIECDRVKGAPFESFSLVGRVVTLPDEDERGNKITSLVFEPTDISSPIESPSKGDASRAKVLEVLRELSSQMPQGVPAKRWEVEVQARGVPRSTFQRHRGGLRAGGEVIMDGALFTLANEDSS